MIDFEHRQVVKELKRCIARCGSTSYVRRRVVADHAVASEMCVARDVSVESCISFHFARLVFAPAPIIETRYFVAFEHTFAFRGCFLGKRSAIEGSFVNSGCYMPVATRPCFE